MKWDYDIQNDILREMEVMKFSQVESNFNSENAWKCLKFRIIFILEWSGKFFNLVVILPTEPY